MTSSYKYIDWICRFIQLYFNDFGFLGDSYQSHPSNQHMMDDLMAILNIKEKCQVLMEVNEMCIPVAEKALSIYISKYIRSLPVHILDHTFKKSRELTNQELKSLRRENEWMEDDDISNRKRIKHGYIFDTSLPLPKKLAGEHVDIDLFEGFKTLSFNMVSLVIKMI
jgi:hypothetical protein